MFERRKLTRYPVEGKVILKLKNDPARSINADLVDLSLVGMGVYSSDKIDIGAVVNFILVGKFYEKSLIGIGKVKYALEIKKADSVVFRLGIEFSNIDQKIIETIIIRIHENEPSQSSPGLKA